jgi:hypothetical protein
MPRDVQPHSIASFHTHGQVDPAAMGRRIVAKYVPAPKRSLAEVRVYTGRPDPRQDSKTYAAHMRQCAEWEKSGLIVVRHRQHRYPHNCLIPPQRRRGLMSSSRSTFVMEIRRADFDVVLSTDTDLLLTLICYAPWRPGSRLLGLRGARSLKWRPGGAGRAGNGARCESLASPYGHILSTGLTIACCDDTITTWLSSRSPDQKKEEAPPVPPRGEGGDHFALNRVSHDRLLSTSGLYPTEVFQLCRGAPHPRAGVSHSSNPT